MWSFDVNKITVLDPLSADDYNNFLFVKNLKIRSKIFLSIDVKETLFEYFFIAVLYNGLWCCY